MSKLFSSLVRDGIGKSSNIQVWMNILTHTELQIAIYTADEEYVAFYLLLLLQFHLSNFISICKKDDKLYLLNYAMEREREMYYNNVCVST